jgi:CheY-like chemotaxis protein
VARILVVDDEPDVRELFNITLKMAGHTTETAKDGMEAVDKLGTDVPDLILLDLMMPRLDGFGLLDHIRKEMDSKPMRVLIATAKVLEEQDKEKLSTWPVVGVLNKGELDIGGMVGIIATALKKDPKPTPKEA